MNILIVGCGRVGSQLANTLDRLGHDVAVIDDNKENFTRLDDNFSGITIEGVAIDQDILRQGGIEGCNAIAALTPDDNTNAMVCQIAWQIFHVEKSIARVYDPMRQNLFQQFHVRTVCSTSLTVDTLFSMLMSSDQRTQQVTFDGGMLNFHTEKMPPEWIGATFDDISRFSTTTQMYLGVVDEYGRITLATNTTRKMSSADRLILASSVE